jgi:hypothetical protein
MTVGAFAGITSMLAGIFAGVIGIKVIRPIKIKIIFVIGCALMASKACI